MITMLNSWKGKVEINGKVYDSIQDAQSVFKTLSDDIDIKLLSNDKKANTSVSDVSDVSESKEVEITVKAYMTKKATVDFDFMQKWNNDIPMPARTMRGEKIKETRGMVYMKLHGFASQTITCMCCGKELTNPISRQYGIGPICLNKMGIDRDIEDVDGISEELVNVNWEGWIIKSAITEIKEV